MQVYIAIVCVKTKALLIAKKKIMNKFWQGKELDKASLVNQAGQYCLPGGRQEHGMTVEATAIKELKEETGVDVNEVLSWRTTHLKMFGDKYKYTCVLLQVSPEEIQMLLRLAKAAIATKSVTDGELESVELVRHPFCHYLGVPQPIPSGFESELSGAREYSQSIDWYKKIGEALDGLFEE